MADIEELVHTERLDLVLVSAETLRCLLRGDRQAGSNAQGLCLPPEFHTPADDAFLRVQLGHIATHPHRRDWCVRAIVRRDDGMVIGHAGFHGPPEAVGRAEIGYTVFARYRRHGYATEAARALAKWAASQGERTLFASIAPDNQPSLAIVRKLGFEQTGTQIDEVDGEELVFELALTPR